MDKLNNIIKFIIEEYEHFIGEEIKKSKEEILEDAEKIYFYKNIKHYFETCEFDANCYISKVLIDKFYPYEDNVFQKINLISFLWNWYSPKENLSVTSFDGIEEIIDLATL